uniref:non-specific serine/threonine protein kinase n=1 Tax=Gibberella zeae TaxID=5518 RepID=A0A4E9ECU0_GIBZA
MDYWLRLNHPIGCITANDQEQLLKCTYYPIWNSGSTENSKFFTENLRHMFYSQRDLKKYFGESERINSYLTCKCETCQKTRNTIKGLPTHQKHLQGKSLTFDGPLVLALLVILRRIHFIYKLPLSAFQRLDELYKSLGKVEWVEEYFPDEQHRKPFVDAFEEVIGMLQPARFIFDSGRFENFPKNTRFPFQNVSTIREAREGVGSIERFEILDEYQDGSIEKVIEKHPGSVDFFFAKKSIPLSSKIDALANEIEILQNVAKFKNDNLIDLLACYEWQKEIHLVFPYIEGTLHDILHGQRPSTPLKVSDRNPLPNNWLWEGMVGMSQALESIHTQIWIPMAEKATRANVAHCDLKPNNILVDNVLVGKEKLKITDFGHCFISFASDDGNSGPMTTHGHPRYAPPETSASTDEWEGDHSHDIGVLNYDVWSLACIMVEVLVYVFDIKELQQKKTPIAQFHEAIRSSPLNECFYDDARSVKRCVNETLTKIENFVLFDKAHQNYKASVITLLRDMFNRNPRRRLSSSQVAERLQSIRADFDKNYNCDERAVLVNSYNPKEDSFDKGDEIAWKFEIDSAIGFVAM